MSSGKAVIELTDGMKLSVNVEIFVEAVSVLSALYASSP